MHAAPERAAPSPWPEVFARVVDLADALDASPLTKHPGCWEHDLGSGLRVVANGRHVPAPSAAGELVPAFTFHVLRDGALLAAATPNGLVPDLDAETKLEVLIAIERALVAQDAGTVERETAADLDAQEASP